MTPAVDQLTAAHIVFETIGYDHDPTASSYGDEAAEKLGLDPDEVFKTLLATVHGGGHDGELVVAIVPTSTRLDLKALARAAGAKKAAMANAEDAERSTGYVVGGISPFGQRRRLATFVDATVLRFDKINVSGGRRGLEIRLAPDDLIRLLRATVTAITDHPEEPPA